MSKYDNPCRECDGGLKIRSEEETTCTLCEGYGHLMTSEGYELIEFLKRRGVSVSMSPLAEEELNGMLG